MAKIPRHITLSLLLTLVLQSLGLAQSAYIPWSKDTRLQWEDFQAEPNLNIIGYAQTSYKIEILPRNILVDENNNIQNPNVLKAEAHFYKNESWVFKKDDNLLAHEQLHFDIAALFAFKIRKEFSKLSKNKIRGFDTYLRVYKDLWRACDVLQKKYDRETNHGLNWDKNKIWIDTITGQLNEQLI
ncbi:DUF922 domain-containing protein [Gaetbulibacter aestuarii]|uniref:DUF922 domain-containing protein n=1 Tax=Gaetbulibacter aestuarii TaxID=1502358 RepID=A0ABW7N1W5_9FLAO